MKAHHLFFLAIAAVGCKQEVELYCDENEPCDDPARPFCDLEGEYAASNGFSNTCIPDPFAEEADAGVQPACSPNETVCDGDMLVTCDEAGRVAESVNCELGCFADKNRCYEFSASNGLEEFFPLTVDAPKLILGPGSVIDTTSGQIFDSSGDPVLIPSTLVQAASDGVDIRTFVASEAELHKVLVKGKPAFALVTSGPIEIKNELRLSLEFGDETPGTFDGAECEVDDAEMNGDSCGGGGGAGFGSVGGQGGDAPGASGARGGEVSGNEQLAPLRGGCGTALGRGGGAIQLVSRTQILLDSDGGILAPGGGAITDPDGDGVVFGFCGGPGGGSGGGILLEAPAVTLSSDSKLIANGGGGACAFLEGADGDTITPAAGGCSGADGAGGNGATAEQPAQPGADGPSGFPGGGGGGGGGLGRIRINSARADGLNDVLASPVPSLGVPHRR